VPEQSSEAVAVQDRLRHTAISGRPVPTLPGGARLALWVIINVEHYEYRPPVDPLRDPWPARPHPDLVNFSRREYGNRVGVWRMLDLLDTLGATATLSLNAAVLDDVPALAEELARRPYDVMGHGVYNTRYAAGLDPDAERALVADVRDTVRRHLDRPLAGWLGPALTTTPRTMDLLAEAGVTYVGDFLHDDEIDDVVVAGNHRLVSLPYSIHLNDSPLIGRTQHASSTFTRLVGDQFDALYAESRERPKIMALCLHPYAINTPGRHRHLADVLAHVLGHEGVVSVNGLELAEHHLATSEVPA
jgi:peptidoglycan/xylan/chitin deacetylase (PgdA/CDA1 family)